MEKSLFKFIWKYSKRQQLAIVAITILSFPVLYISLELPKRIINEAIGDSDFPKTFLGMQFDQVPYLLALCFAFLGLVVVNNGIKYVLNTYKGLTGERMLRRLRYQLYERVLRFRLTHFGKISSGEIIPMITSEVQTVGGFVADAIALPAFQGGTLLVYLVFIFMQDPLLGAAAIALYPVQGFIIPRLQRKVNQLGKERVKNLRQLSDRIGETIGGVREIHANDTNAYHLAEISDKLQTNFEIRFEVFKRKFGIKFLNNFLNQLTPFFFYSIGGYLVIRGNISFGALVAVLAAYKDLAGPWKELLAYYQQMADTLVKYDTVIEQFDPPDLYPADRLEDAKDIDISGADKISVQNAGFIGAGSGQTIEAMSLSVPLEGTTAIIGPDGSGRTQLIQLLAGLISPTSGRVTIGGHDVGMLPTAIVGRDFAYVDPLPYIFTGTIRSNIIYGLSHRPLDPLDGDEVDEALFQRRYAEARLTGARGYEIGKRWEDLDAAGVSSEDALDARMVDLVTEAGLGADIYRMGLQSRVDSHADPRVLDSILAARQAISDRVISEPEFGEYVHLWHEDKFNGSASVIENLVFGLPANSDASPHDLAAMREVKDAIKAAGLYDDLVEVGRRIAETMVELFSDISDENELLSAYSFIPRDEIPEYGAMLARGAKAGGFNDADQTKLVGLSFMLIPTRHRLGLITPELQEKIVSVRAPLREALEKGRPDDFDFFADDKIFSSLSIEDNLLYGRPRLDRPKARQAIERFIGEIVDEVGLRDVVMRAGLAFEVGVSGSRLSSTQKQRVAMVRAALRRPRIVFVDGLISGGKANDPVFEFFRAALPDSVLVCGLLRADIANSFDHVIVLRDGHLIAEGTPEAVQDELSPLREAAE